MLDDARKQRTPNLTRCAKKKLSPTSRRQLRVDTRAQSHAGKGHGRRSPEVGACLARAKHGRRYCRTPHTTNTNTVATFENDTREPHPLLHTPLSADPLQRDSPGSEHAIQTRQKRQDVKIAETSAGALSMACDGIADRADT